MSSFLITIFLILNSYFEAIQSKPVNEDNNNNNKRNENNNTLKIFLIIVALFIIGSILYFTKSLWWGCIKKLFVKEKSEPKPSDSDSITDKTFENIQFDSINFSEIHGNSSLSIDITNIIEKYINSSKDSTSLSSIIELGSISQSSTPRPNSKTFINISNNYSSPNLENYNIFENELNNLKTQEITDSKIPMETSYIENSPSFLNDESSSISKKILIGINNIEIKPNIKIEALENQDSIKKEKCESIKSKKSIISKKSHKSENKINNDENGDDDDDDENESISNTGININDEKTLINKSLKPVSLDGDTSIQEINSDNSQELSNGQTSSNESKNNNKEQSSDEVQIVTQTEDEEPVSSIQDNDLVISSPNHDISVTHPSSLKANNQFNGYEELSISSSEESISNIGAKIDPVDTNDDSMSSLDLGEVNSSQEDEEYIDDINQSSVESLEVLESNNNSQLLSIPVPEEYYEKNQQTQSYVIIKDNKPVGGIEVIITPSPDETEKSSAKIIEPITEVENAKTEIENDIKVDEIEKPSSEVEADVKVDETEKPSSEIEADVKVEETEKPSSEIETDVKVDESEKPSSEIEADVKVDESEKPSSEIEADVKVDESEKPSSEIEADVKVDETDKPSSEIEADVKVDETEKPSSETETDVKVDETEKPSSEIEADVKVDETEKPSSEIEADVKVDESEKPISEIEADVKVDETEKPLSEIEADVKVDETEKPSFEIEADVKVDETEKPSSEIEANIKVDETEKPSSEIETGVKVDETKKPSSEIEVDAKVNEIEKSSVEIVNPSTETENGEAETDTKFNEAEISNEIDHSTESEIERVDLQNDSNVEPRIDNKKLEVDNQKVQMEKIEENIKTIQTSLENEITDIKPPLYEINENATKSSEENNEDEDKTKPVIKLNKRTSSLNLHIKKRRESIGSKTSYYSSKKNKQNKAKKIQQSINEEIESIANEIDNDAIKEKFNDYVEKRNSIQSDTSSNSLNNRRASALSTYILQNENSEIPHDESENNIEKSKNNNKQSSKLALNIDTSIDDIQPIKEDNTPDKQSPSITPSSFTASQLHNQLRSPTPTGFYNNYSYCISPSLSTASDSDSLRDQCISPTPSEDSTISSGSHSYSIGKISRHKQFEVVYDHKPQLPDEIPLRKGDIVQIKQVFEDGWAYGIVKKKRMDGIFPIQCLGEEIEPSRNGRMVPRLVRVYQARLEDEEQERQEEEEFKRKVTDQARKNLLLKLALSHPK